MIKMTKHLSTTLLWLSATLLPASTFATDLYWETDIHDPSTIQLDNTTYWTFGTGDGIVSRYSSDLATWQHSEPVFPVGTWPSWIDDYVTNFEGSFWAPDVIQMNGKYYIYYSAYGSINGGTGFESAIGVAVSDSLNNPNWQDLGMVVSSKTEPLTPQGEPTNTIDAGLYRDADGNVWMAYGSHYGGIFVTQIDPTTGKRMSDQRYPVVGHNGAWNEYEGAQVTYINGYYYMFVNLGECCAGDDSTYYIVVGRSTSPTGPFLDKDGVDLYNYGGTTLLTTEGDYIGPGHYGYFNNNGQNLVSIHYYDGTTADGWPARLDLLEMSFSNGWPVWTRNFTIDGATAPTPVTAGLTNGGTYTITAAHSGKLVDVARDRRGNPGGSDGTNVEQRGALNDGTQQWVFKQVNEYYWSIHPAHATTKALDVYNFGETDGTNINIWDYWGGMAQNWRFIDLGNGYFQAVARHSSKCMNVAGASTADGANVEQQTCDGAAASQQFLFTPAN